MPWTLCNVLPWIAASVGWLLPSPTVASLCPSLLFRHCFRRHIRLPSSLPHPPKNTSQLLNLFHDTITRPIAKKILIFFNDFERRPAFLPFRPPPTDSSPPSPGPVKPTPPQSPSPPTSSSQHLPVLRRP